ncbi:hypothetical protein ACIQ6V_26930 [Streptomyces sp. NPDC096198]|uniref:hypothetical protein n=1 Tax=Streptomyces sp. NPDC096198 TaxID=3366080 RepID=UPI0038243E3B
MDQYKSARAEAEHTAALLRAALRRAGLPEYEAARVRALITGKGCAYVEIGALPVSSAVKLLSTLPPVLLKNDVSGFVAPAEATE